MRVTTAFKRLLDLPGVTVTDVDFSEVRVVVTLKLAQRHLRCPECSFTTMARYDSRPVLSSWRHLDLARWRLDVRASLRRIECPTHGVRTEGVPFARPGARFTRDFENLVGWLATTMDKTAIRRLLRVDWDSVGRIIERVMATELDPARLDKLYSIGVDEVSWRKGHFSGVTDPCGSVAGRGLLRGWCHTLWVPCATCRTVSHMGKFRAGLARHADRHAGLLDGGRRRLAASPGR
ncbi:MAG: helix-turn-helix domain-containing protein [Acidimicrobiales bacterium]